MSIETIRHNQTIQDERWDMCEHLQIGDKASVVFCEDDSFGPVLRNALCEECGEKALQEHRERLMECDECHADVPAKEIRIFKPFDFHAPSGDEPTHLCDRCWNSPTWVERRKKDKEDYEREMDFDEPEFDEEDWEDDEYHPEDEYNIAEDEEDYLETKEHETSNLHTDPRD